MGERSDPLCDGTRAERRDDERSAPREETPAPARGAQPGNDLELVFARRRELSANFGEAFLVFPRQCPLSGVGRTFVSPAVVAVHDLNAKAATHSAVGMSTCAAGPGHLVNARSRLDRLAAVLVMEGKDVRSSREGSIFDVTANMSSSSLPIDMPLIVCTQNVFPGAEDIDARSSKPIATTWPLYTVMARPASIIIRFSLRIIGVSDGPNQEGERDFLRRCVLGSSGAQVLDHSRNA